MNKIFGLKIKKMHKGSRNPQFKDKHSLIENFQMEK